MSVRRLLAILCAAASCVAVLSGCVSPDSESEIPWNAPQAWEGSPMIPGLSE